MEGQTRRVIRARLRSARRLLLRERPATDWEGLLARDQAAWAQARQRASASPRVLIATSTGGHGAATPVESLLGVALTLRGARVGFLLCDRLLPACLQADSRAFGDQQEFIQRGPSRVLCADCYAGGEATYRPLRLPVFRFSQFVTPEDRERSEALARSTPGAEIATYRLDGLSVGEHAQAGALRYFATGGLDGEPHGEAVLRRYFQAALLTVQAVRRLQAAFQPDCMCCHHGIYIPLGVIGEVARASGVRVVNWNPAYRKGCFVFSHDDTYHHTMLSEPTDVWERMPWTPQMEAELMAYLNSRWHGTRDWIWFHENPQSGEVGLAALGIDGGRPTIGMLTNITWDAQVHYPANLFPDTRTWVMETIRYFAGRPDVRLLIRVHPAERRGLMPSRQPMVEEIAKTFPELPSNVHIIPPESPISTYAAMLQCDSVIIYGTKAGVELASFGMPVIVAGEAWVRNKGVTMDPRTVEEYFQLLDRLPLGRRLDAATARRARMYAFHYFFRRMIPLSMMIPTDRWPPYRVDIAGLDDLAPGRDPGLDLVCDGILRGSSFIFPAEEMMS